VNQIIEHKISVRSDVLTPEKHTTRDMHPAKERFPIF